MGNYIFSFNPKRTIIRKPDIFYSIHSPNGLYPIVEAKMIISLSLSFLLLLLDTDREIIIRDISKKKRW